MIGIKEDNHPPSPALYALAETIHLEAAPVLYEANIFQFSYPVVALKWLHSIGATNTGFLRTLRVFVEAIVERSSSNAWYAVFEKLGREARGLRSMEVYLDQCGMYRGLGTDVKFARALAEIKSLEFLEMAGFYCREWPDYLERNMDVRVLRTPT